MMIHSILRKVKDRLDLLNLINELEYDGCGVELGVAKGSYSNHILQVTKLKLFSIDRWSDHHGEDQYQETIELLKQYGDRSTIIRKTFHDAVIQFQDASFDFIYIDGYAGEGQENGETLADWWPKLRSRGLFSGHDYSKRWSVTISIVNQFLQSHNLTICNSIQQDTINIIRGSL